MMAEQIYVSPNRCESEQELNDFIDNIDKDFCQNNLGKSYTIGFDDRNYRKQVWAQYHEFFGKDKQAHQIVADWLEEAYAALGMPLAAIVMNTIYEKALQRVKNDLSDDIPSIQDLYVDDDENIECSQTDTLENIEEELQEMYEAKGAKWFKEKDNFAVREIFSLLEIDFADYAEMIETEKEVEDFLDDFPNETEWRESFNIALKESTSNNFALLFKSENRSFLFIGEAEECGGTLPIDDFESITHYFDISKAGITENGNFFITGLPFEETHHKKQHETFEIKSLSDKAYERFLKDFVDDGRLLVEKDFVLYSIPNDYARKLYDDDKATIQLKVENIANVSNIRKNR